MKAILLVLIILAACTQIETTPTPLRPAPIPSTTSETQKEIITHEELLALGANTNSPNCQKYLQTVITIEGPHVWTLNNREGSGGQATRNYLGIKTKDNCIIYIEKDVNEPFTLGTNYNITGLVTGGMAGQSPILLIIPGRAQSICAKQPTCPTGQTVKVTKYYEGGTQSGCPFKWDCV
jgi:hypothetical protein